MIAAFGAVATIGYLMYLADAMGYLGYVAVMVFRNTTSGEADFLNLLLWASGFVAVVSSVISILLGGYYYRRIPRSIESD